MTRVRPLFFAAACAMFVLPAVAECAETATSTVTVSAEFTTVTSLKVSSQSLQFVESGADQPAVAVVEYSAGARTRQGGEVLLIVEPLASIASGDAADPVLFSGEGVGAIHGVLSLDAPTPVARWSGSGLRKGRLTFTSAARGGGESIPVRFVLSAP